jgi:ABC-type phosphate/phosphonate transport system substrate-binding protein
MKRLLFLLIVIAVYLSEPVCAQMKFGMVPDQNSLVRSEDEAKLFSAYLEDRLEERITIHTAKNEQSLYQGLVGGKIDLAVVSNIFYKEHAKNLHLLANFTRSDETTHKLLLIVPKNSSIRSLGDLKRGKPTLVLDEMSRSRISFLTKTLEADPDNVFKRIRVSAQDMDTLSGLLNGTYDAACIEDGLLEAVKHFDPTLVQQLKVLKSSGALASDPFVGRKGLSTHFLNDVTKVLVNMDNDSDGRQILLGLKITQFLSPLTNFSLYPSEVDPAKFRREKKKKTQTAAVVQKPSVPNKEETVPIIEEPEPAKKDPLTVSPENKTDTSAAKEPVRPEEDQETSGGTASVQREQSIPNDMRTEREESPEAEKGMLQDQSKASDLPVASEQQHKAFYFNFKTLGAAILLFVLLLIILYWVFRRKGQQVEGEHEREPETEESAPVMKEVKASSTDEISEVQEDQTSHEAAQSAFSNEDDVIRSSFGDPPKTSLVELRGELKTIRVPDLLQLMGSCKNTGTLVVQSKHDEKCLYFRNGKVCSASCLDKDNKNKLGSLLIKLGKITERERARALALCAENSEMRLGKALIQIKAVRQEELREVLRIQAEEIVYSLFLFPEGRFEFIKKEPKIDPEEDLALDVMNLLMEGARREDEWENMRQAIPTMDIILDFTREGKEKLNGTDMSRDQELTLSLINGERSVREICVRSTMVDFEVCDFLYRLIKLSVLHRVEIAQ